MDSFYDPNWESGKAIRWRIKRRDNEHTVSASIWERIIDCETGEIITSFSMLTINAYGHEVMKHFHKPQDEKRSIVVFTPNDFLVSEPAPLFRITLNGKNDLFTS